MRRRLTLTVVGLVAAALVVAGAGTLVLARAAARGETRQELEEQSVALAQVAEGLQGRPAVLANLRHSLRLTGAELIVLGSDTRIRRSGVVAAAPVGGVILSGTELEQLHAGTAVVSGWRGNVAYAAAPVSRPGPIHLAVMLTREQTSGLGVALPWFLLSAAGALAAAAIVADRLSQRFARPVSAAAEAARRIAAGDLAVRVDPGDPGAEEELARLAAAVNAMAADLERARGQQRQFLLSVSHELRTPLTSVRGFAEAIADGAAPDTRRAAEVIGAEARRLERLVADLLDLAKLEARSFSLHMQAVDAAVVVADTVEGFRPAASGAGLVLDLDTAAGGQAMVTADPERLAQVVANLVENALKFAATRIAVEVGRRAGDVVIAVSDDGPGVPPGDLPRLFDRLFQSSRPAARQAGSGLGLAIVAELAAAMGARVEAASEPGATRMAVRLPPR